MKLHGVTLYADFCREPKNACDFLRAAECLPYENPAEVDKVFLLGRAVTGNWEMILQVDRDYFHLYAHRLGSKESVQMNQFQFLKRDYDGKSMEQFAQMLHNEFQAFLNTMNKKR